MNDTGYAPVVLFTYNRPKHTQKTIEALERNLLSEKSPLFLFVDGYKDEGDKREVEEVRSLLYQYKNKSHFHDVTIYVSDCHKGLANSVIDGVSRIIARYGNVIVLEDDLITSPDFLKYMNMALDYYENEEKIWSIAGYSPNIKQLLSYKNDVYMCLRAGSWGWATWNNRWKTVDWEVNSYKEFCKDRQMRKKFQKCGMDMPDMLDRQMRGEIDSWAIRFCYEQFRQGKLTVNPTVSRVQNIGMDGSGTHGTVDHRWDVDCNRKIRDIRLIPAERDYAIEKAYYRFYAGGLWDQTGGRLKSYLYQKLYGKKDKRV